MKDMTESKDLEQINIRVSKKRIDPVDTSDYHVLEIDSNNSNFTKEQCKSLKSKLESQLAEYPQLKEKAEMFEKAMLLKKANLGEYQKLMDGLKFQNEQLQQQNKKLSDDYKNLLTINDKKTMELNTYKGNVILKDKEIQKLSDENKQLQAKINNIKKIYDDVGAYEDYPEDAQRICSYVAREVGIKDD